jgi:BlaI family penicillinase repressor
MVRVKPAMYGGVEMEMPKIFESEYRFCEILWENEPVSSTELVRLCREKLEWKKSTTYTVIKRLSQRGVLKSENAIVTSLLSKEDVQSEESAEIVERSFSGSLPDFIAAFTRKRKLSGQEIEEIQRIINTYK